MQSARLYLTGAFCLLAAVMGGCSIHSHQPGGPGAQANLASASSLVLPTIQSRTVARIARIPAPGSDFGVFVARRDHRAGVASSRIERLSSGYERSITDRQISNLGRPRTSYASTTRAITRIDR